MARKHIKKNDPNKPTSAELEVSDNLFNHIKVSVDIKKVLPVVKDDNIMFLAVFTEGTVVLTLKRFNRYDALGLPKVAQDIIERYQSVKAQTNVISEV